MKRHPLACRLFGHKTRYMGMKCLRCGSWYVFGDWLP